MESLDASLLIWFFQQPRISTFYLIITCERTCVHKLYTTTYGKVSCSVPLFSLTSNQVLIVAF
jgi:hypothetical protein